MRTINITNQNQRDAQVCMESTRTTSQLRRVLETGQVTISIKVLKQNLALAFDTLSTAYPDLTAMAQAIIDADPEIDMELIGKHIGKTHKLYLNQDNQIAYRVNMVQIVKDRTGQEIQRRDLTKAPSNVTGDSIVVWSGRKYPKAQAIRRFVFTRKVQIKHVSGLTYDFLHAIAKDLHDTDSLMLIGGGKKGTEPLVMTQGGEPYRGFLEGRVDNDKYCLILHLTNLEVKAIA